MKDSQRGRSGPPPLPGGEGASFSEKPKGSGFPLWILAVIIPIGGVFLLCCGCAGLASLRDGGKGDGGKGPPARVISNQADLYELNRVIRNAPAGMNIHNKTFILDCRLGSHPAIRDGDYAVYVDNGLPAYVIRNSTAGRQVQALLGDGGKHKIMVELGAPSKQRLDVDLEIIGAWSAK